MTLCSRVKKIEEEAHRGIDKRRQEGKVGLRCPDTNAYMADPDVIYRLSGNLSEIDDLNRLEFLLGSSVIDKSPHDILLPLQVFRELDHIKDTSKSGAHRTRARRALNSIENLLRKSLGNDFARGRLDYRILDGHPISFKNGAKLYISDVSAEYVKNNHRSAWKAGPDALICMTVGEFLETHKEYKKVTFITRDSGARSTAMILEGILGVPFRFAQTTNPLQLNRGWASVDVDYRTFHRLRKNEEISIDGPIVKIDPDSLLSNQAIEFRKKRRAKKGREYDSHYMIYVPGSRVLRHARYYEEFMDFMLYYRIEKKSDMANLENVDRLIKLAHRHLSAQQRVALRTKYNRLVKRKKKKGSDKKLQRMFDDLLKIPEVKSAYHATERVLPYDFRRCNLIPKGLQIPFIDHMVNPDITITSIDAIFGFGKTLWPLAVGLYHLEKGNYSKIVYYASMSTADESVGTLPGDYNEKIEPKIRPARMAMHRLFGDPLGTNTRISEKIDDLVSRGFIEFNVISDVKGVTQNRAFVIIDEIQFYTEDQLLLAISRLGDNSKAVVCSSIDQVRSSTDPIRMSEVGIFDLVESLSGVDDYAHLTPPKMEVYRGRGAQLAALVKSRARRYA